MPQPHHRRLARRNLRRHPAEAAGFSINVIIKCIYCDHSLKRLAAPRRSRRRPRRAGRALRRRSPGFFPLLVGFRPGPENQSGIPRFFPPLLLLLYPASLLNALRKSFALMPHIPLVPACCVRTCTRSRIANSCS